MIVATLGLVSALVYGVSDYLGGIASRRITPLLAVGVTFVVADVVALVAVLVERPDWTWTDLGLGLLAGVAGALGTWAFYGCLAIGPMSVLSPTVAVVYAVLPAAVGILRGERFSPLGYAALVVVVIAAALLGVSKRADGSRLSLRALLLALGAGLGFAGYITIIDLTAPSSGLVPLFGDYISGTIVIGILLAVLRWRLGPRVLAGVGANRATALAVAAGVLLAFANILLVIGLHLGDLAVMSVLNALYPLSTIVLALWLLGERLTVWQWFGVALGLGGAAVLAVS